MNIFQKMIKEKSYLYIRVFITYFNSYESVFLDYQWFD